MTYKIYVRDPSLNRVGRILDYNNIDFIPRFNDVGSFVLELPTDSWAGKELIKPQYGILITKNSKTIFSGNVTNRKRVFNATQDLLTLSGLDDNAILRNVAYPEINGQFDQKDYDVRTGNAESIMKQYVYYNIGPMALPERQRVLVEQDKGLGTVVTGRARFHTLLELFQGLALAGGGLGFRVIQVDKHLEFQVYQVNDLTKKAIFSPLLKNLIDFEYTNINPTANYVIVGGGGEGKERILLSKSDNASISKYGRIETFVDQRNTEEREELEQALTEELENKVEQNSLSISPIDTENLQFGRDYQLGDKVSIILTQPNEVIEKRDITYFVSMFQASSYEERVRKIQQKLEVIQDVVREITISITPDGVSIKPTIGTSDSIANPIRGIFDKMAKQLKRISNLERR